MGRLEEIRKRLPAVEECDLSLHEKDRKWLLDRVDELKAVFDGKTVLKYMPGCECEKCKQIAKAISKLKEK